jgi:hypothetical protein
MKKRPKTSTRKKAEYPEFTEADSLAAQIRRRANKLTPEQRAEYVRRGMVKIYGGQWPKEATGTRH